MFFLLLGYQFWLLLSFFLFCLQRKVLFLGVYRVEEFSEGFEGQDGVEVRKEVVGIRLVLGVVLSFGVDLVVFCVGRFGGVVAFWRLLQVVFVGRRQVLEVRFKFSRSRGGRGRDFQIQFEYGDGGVVYRYVLEEEFVVIVIGSYIMYWVCRK